MHQMRSGIVQKVADTASAVLLDAQVIQGVVAENPKHLKQGIWPFLFNFLKYDDTMSAMTVTLATGELLSAIDLTMAHRKYYYSRPNEMLPQGAKYAMRDIERSEGNELLETWFYFDTDQKLLATEQVPVAYDARTEALFIAEENWPAARWQYAFPSESSEGSLNVTIPIFSVAAQSFLGFVTLDLSLQVLTNFLTLEELGKTGSAFIFDQRGAILLPPADAQINIPQAIAEAAYQDHAMHHIDDFLFKEQGVEYLVSIAHFPISLEEKWLVMFIVPLNDFFGPFLKTQHQSLLISIVIILCSGILVYFASKHISNPIVQLAKEVDKIKQLDLTERKPIRTSITELITLDFSITALRAALRSFQHYIPKEIVQALVVKGGEIALGGERREVSVLFSDIKDFTTIAEEISIEELTNGLAKYFDALSKIILSHEGTIDKYIGDSIMAFWNAPQDVANHATKACLTALLLSKACLSLKQEGSVIWETRFGLHTGEVIVGNIGTEQRMNYTIIGNMVNIASRLQSLNKEYRTSIIISDTVHEMTGAQFVTRPLDFVAVKGKKNRIVIHELFGVRTGEEGLKATAEQIKLSEAFATAFAFFHDGKMKEAEEIFVELQKQYPADYPTSYYLQRIRV